MEKFTKFLAYVLVGAVTVGAALIVGSVVGAIFGGISTVIANYFFPYLGAKAMALTSTATVWQAGVVLGFFSGFIKSTLTTRKKD